MTTALELLKKAVEEGDVDGADLIIRYADIDLNHNYDMEGWDLLQLAAVNEDIPMLQMLLRHRADVNHVNEYGQTALHIAVTIDNVEVIRFLLANRADATMRDVNGNEAIDLAGRNIEIIALLENNVVVDNLGFNGSDYDISSFPVMSEFANSNNINALGFIGSSSSSDH
jgi:ankyrin repeat protein